MPCTKTQRMARWPFESNTYVYVYEHILYIIRAFYITVTAIEELRICTIRDMPGRHVSII